VIIVVLYPRVEIDRVYNPLTRLSIDVLLKIVTIISMKRPRYHGSDSPRSEPSRHTMSDAPVTRATPAGEVLPAIVGVRTRVVEAGRNAVVVEFENDAEICYRETETGVEEVFVGPDDDRADPAAVHDRGDDEDPEVLAVRTVGEYLSFDGRARATFVWGEQNLNALLGE
jgi:hypothetical protein